MGNLSQRYLNASKVKNCLRWMLDALVARRLRKRINYYLKAIPPAKLDALRLEDTDKCLVLAPHADDESIALGGLMLQHPHLFDVVCLTDCSTGNPRKPREEASAERRLEFTDAMESLGVNRYRFNLDIPNDDLQNRYAEFTKLLLDISIEDYTYLFLPHPFDQHPDHMAVGKHFRAFCIKHLLQHKCALLFYEVWSPMTFPNFYADISGVIEKKMRLVNRYASQVQFIDYARRIQGLNYYRGMIPHVEFAECFQHMSIPHFVQLPI